MKTVDMRPTDNGGLLVLFSFADYGWFYLGFICFVMVVLALDLGIFHKKTHEVSFKESSPPSPGRSSSSPS